MKTRLTLLTCLMGALSLLLSWHLVCGFTVTAQSTLTPRPHQRSSTIDMSALSNPKMILGVMGAVKTPGVYHFPGDQVTIKQLLEQAGQTTESATGSVRIVRGSYVNMKLFLPSQENFVLKPSDLLIVESKSPATQKIIDLSKLRQASHETPASNNIQIGLVNLLDYPMLVTLKPGDASLKTVFLDLLKQSPDIVKSTQLIEAVARPRNEPITPEYRLTDGAVLVFDARSVNRDALPEFPQPFEVKLASHTQPAGEAFIPPALPEITPAAPEANRQVAYSAEPADSVLPDPSTILAPPTASGPQPYVRQGDLLDMNIPPLTPSHSQAAPQTDLSRLPQSMSMPNMQQADMQQMPQQPYSGVTMTPAIASKTKGPQAYVRDRSENIQQPGQMTPQMQAIIAQLASHHGQQLSPEQMQAMQMASMQTASAEMNAVPMRSAQRPANTPIDLTAQIEQQERSADPSTWNLPVPDPVSSTDMTTQSPVQTASVDNRVAQFDPYDDVRSDFPRRQFLQNLPENESAAAVKPPVVHDRLDSADATVTQLVPLPTEDPFDMHKEAYTAQQYRWTAMGIVGLAVICVATASLWMKFGSRFSLRRLVETKAATKPSLQLHSAPATNIVTSSYQPVQKMALTTYDQLQALIENQLPIVEESVALTMGQTLYGEPNVSKLFRYDDSHVDPQTGDVKLSGPHFKIKPNTAQTQTGFNQLSMSAPHFKQRPKPTAEKVTISEEAKIPIVPQEPLAEPIASSDASSEPLMFRVDGPESPIADKAKEKPHHFEVSAQELLERTRAYIQREKQQ